LCQLSMCSRRQAHCRGWWAAALCYFAVTAVTGVYLGLIVPINHLAMSSFDCATAPGFIAQQVATTRNITSSPLRDVLFIGQNSQIEHHLFPWVPTFNLPRGRNIVREFCREQGIEYRECSFGDAVREVYRYLVAMARPPAAPAPGSALAPPVLPTLHDHAA